VFLIQTPANALHDIYGVRIRKGAGWRYSRASTDDTEKAKECGETAFSRQTDLIRDQLLEDTPGEKETRREDDRTEML